MSSTIEMGRQQQICVRCIMDTSDPEIRFDDEGVCSHCRNFAELQRRLVPPAERAGELARLTDEIKRRGRGHDYDCVIGLSGGVDSTYVAHVVVRQLGLRPLAVHLDNGWNSELAVRNIEQTVRKLNVDLHTHVLDWEEFRDLQVAFLRASVPDGEIPTDHAIGAVLLETAVRRGITTLISGSNIATEGIMPGTWTYGVSDWRYISAVHRRFGKRRLRSFPHYTFLQYGYYLAARGLRSVRLLDYLEYDKACAMETISRELGWRYYGGKHYESIYTRFFQGYLLPRKFGIDKRRAHLSTLINAGQMDRERALELMEEPTYPEAEQKADLEYVTKKLGLTLAEFDEIMCTPPRSHHDYPNSEARRKRIWWAVDLGKRMRIVPQRNAL